MPLEIVAIASGGLALVALVWMVVARTATAGDRRRLQARSKGVAGASKPR